MSDQEIRDIWSNANEGDRIKLDIPQLVDNLRTKTKKIDRSLLFRDAREIIAALAVMVFFGYDSYKETLMVPKVAYIFIAIWCIYIIYKILSVRKYKKISELSNSLKAQLLQQKMYLQKQAHLLDTVLSWYIGPPALFMMVAIVGRNYSVGFDRGILTSLLTISLICLGIYFLNKFAAKTIFKPLIENIDNVLIQLEENNEVI